MLYDVNDKIYQYRYWVETDKFEFKSVFINVALNESLLFNYTR
jgi:hypothetical protein